MAGLPGPSLRRLRLAAALSVGLLIVGSFFGLWSTLSAWVAGMGRFLAASTEVPNWLLGLFALCAVIVAGWLGASLRPQRARPRGAPISSEETFFNIRWRWSYEESGAVRDLTPHCLRCGHRLVLQDLDHRPPVRRYECRCERCGSVACEIDCPVEEFEQRVLQRIHEAGG